MKTESNVKFILRLAVTLLLITGVVAAVLAGVNAITAPRIAAHTEEKTQKAIEEVLTGGEPLDSFTILDSFSDETGLITKVYSADPGYAVEVAANGFGGTVTMMVGVSREGQVLGISIVSHSETAGLGAVAAADTSKGEQFRQQYKGKTGELTVIKSGEAAQDEVNAISGATITSRAVTEGVNAAVACVANMG